MTTRNPIRAIRLAARSHTSLRYATSRGAIGTSFGWFGRDVGRRLLRARSRTGFSYLLTPVNITRYFEFPFAASCLPERFEDCADVGSPRLFALYVARRYQPKSILMLNPDSADLGVTATIAGRLGVPGVRTVLAGVDVLEQRTSTYDCVWSLSVVEHIDGDYDDMAAVRYMYNALREGGRLILTIPVDREFRREYRDRRYYGSAGSTRGRFFFQRLYDESSIRERLVAPLGVEPTIVRWFGEKERGRYAAYEERWLSNGHACTVDDPREIADHYREYESWEAMPGRGVCGLMIERRGDRD